MPDSAQPLFPPDSVIATPETDPIPPAVAYSTHADTPRMTVEEDAERPFWVAWNRVRGIGPARFGRILEIFGAASVAWQASIADLRGVGIDEKLAATITHQRATIDPEKEMARLERHAVTVLTLRDAAYPRLLREIGQPPAVLYVRGQLTLEDEMALAVVGTRRITSYGRQVTSRLVRELAERRMTIVSGLARGVDAVAHTTALDAGGRTIAVLGCGPDLVYPPEHAKLAERIVEQGAVVSEFAAGMPPEAGNFPARNRIISGLSLAVLVTEAPADSGALITATFAAEQGRDVMAVPGNITQRTSAGCNRLIREGALCVTEATDIIEALNLHMAPQQMDMRALLPDDPTELRVLACLDAEPRHADDLCQMLDLPAATISGTLMMLELKGLVHHLGNMMYERA
jgi:DNA processing protein